MAYSDYMSEDIGTGQFIKELDVKVTIIVHQNNTSNILSTTRKEPDRPIVRDTLTFVIFGLDNSSRMAP